ncbi:MAG: hypothetical protein M3N43_07630, partial [Actinomycetota bacterium]|nr:hypothetical protein [Actinomycetota bacterium]
PSLHVLECWVETLDVTDRSYQAAFGEGIAYCERSFEIVGKRFLDESVDPGLGQADCTLLVLLCRRHQHHGIRPGFDEVVEGREERIPCEGPVYVACRVGATDEMDSVEAGQHSGVVSAHVPQTGDSYP